MRQNKKSSNNHKPLQNKPRTIIRFILRLPLWCL